MYVLASAALQSRVGLPGFVAEALAFGAAAFADGAPLDYAAFANLLRVNFGLRLTPAELGALVVLFDRDGDGCIEYSEFVAFIEPSDDTDRTERKLSSVVVVYERLSGFAFDLLFAEYDPEEKGVVSREPLAGLTMGCTRSGARVDSDVDERSMSI